MDHIVKFLEGETDTIEMVTIKDLKAIRKRFGCVFFERNCLIEDITSHIKNQLTNHIAGHKIIIRENYVEIGCKCFSKILLKGLLELYDLGVLFSKHGLSSVNTVPLRLMWVLSEYVDITAEGFRYEGHNVNVKEVRSWVS